MKLYTTGEFISNDISFEKKSKNNLTRKMKLNCGVSFEKKKKKE